MVGVLDIMVSTVLRHRDFEATEDLAAAGFKAISTVLRGCVNR